MDGIMMTVAIFLILKGAIWDWCNDSKVDSFDIGIGLFLVGFVWGIGFMR